MEDVPEGEKSQYDGYALRFAPLSENAVKESWSGTLKGTGGASTKFTLLGFLQAGCPTKLQLFPPDADPDNDEPELSLSFKLSAPVTEVTIGGGLSIDEVVGSYRVVLVGTDFDGTWLLTKNDNEQLVDETGDLVYDYNPKTGIATVSYENEAGSGTAEITFTSENGKIHLSCHWVYTNEGPENTYVRDYKGTKID